MKLFDVLNYYCTRRSALVPDDDKRRHSYMLKRLLSSKFPIQCELVNRLDTDPVCAANLLAMLCLPYNGLPAFLKTKVSQKKKKESVRKFFEDDIIDKYMEFNSCGIREVEEAFEFNRDEVEKSLKLIKKNFFDGKSDIIIKRGSSIDDGADENNNLF